MTSFDQRTTQARRGDGDLGGIGGGRMDGALALGDLAALRRAFDERAMVAAICGGLRDPYPPSRGLLEWIEQDLYSGDRMKPLERERTLIAILAARRSPGALSIHLYWGLMAGLAIEDIAQTLVLSATYQGIDVYALGLRTLRATLEVLSAQVARGGEALSCVAVVTSLLTRIPL